MINENASAFVGQEFHNFCRVNGIQHMTSAPHHPASNGLAERAVGIVKEAAKRMEGGDLETKLTRFLFDYRATPHATLHHWHSAFWTVDASSSQNSASAYQTRYWW